MQEALYLSQRRTYIYIEKIEYFAAKENILS